MLSQSKATQGKFAGGSAGIATKGYIVSTPFIKVILDAVVGAVRSIINAINIKITPTTEAIHLSINAEAICKR